MRLSEKIKFECFCAFIHSRLTSAGTYAEGSEIFNEKDIVNKLDSIGSNVIKQIESISTIKLINHKIQNAQSGLIANMYHKNYSKLLDVMDKHIKKEDECIMPLIGIGMLMAYFENEKNENRIKNITLKELMELYNCFDKYMEQKELKIKMMKTATQITEEYL